MQVIDLFSGIGGFSLAAHWLGWETVQFVEKDSFCQKVLAKNFLSIPIHSDICTFGNDDLLSNGLFNPKLPSVLTGGFPCQPFSHAGKREGENDDRHLFPEMLRVVEEVRPSWVVAENVRGLLSIGNGQVFENVAASLESIGYAVQTFCIPASAVNAPHRRDRLWIVGNSDTKRQLQPQGIKQNVGRRISDADFKTSACAESAEREFTRNSRQRRAGFTDNNFFASNTISEQNNRIGRDCQCGRLGMGRNTETAFGDNRKTDTNSVIGQGWDKSWFEAATRLCALDDGLPRGLVRPAGWRVNALKAAGNSIVPAIAYQIFQAIDYAENQCQK